MMGTMMQDLAFAIPGVDEAMSFAEIMKCVRLVLSSRLGSVAVVAAAVPQSFAPHPSVQPIIHQS